jgi:hypothetical protein
MSSYLESLETAKKRVYESSLSAEDKSFLTGLLPKISPDMLEVFLWMLAGDQSDLSALAQKTRQLVASASDAAELEKAVQEDKKALEARMSAEELPIL